MPDKLHQENFSGTALMAILNYMLNSILMGTSDHHGKFTSDVAADLRPRSSLYIFESRISIHDHGCSYMGDNIDFKLAYAAIGGIVFIAMKGRFLLGFVFTIYIKDVFGMVIAVSKTCWEVGVQKVAF
ncbi:hypothetical protein KFK09_016666 [Dendrobium nobile]|uniref:Uncharacterized protein n=1 Tax=Dendrobium nobile TaxID=94219 RepID=A0A8T3B048_DENNO|nr:hypothetical protein KFK09_016666 [Dendrobium nobile]